MIVCVCPPQISISTQGRVVHWAISEASARAIRESRYSSRYFMARSLLSKCNCRVNKASVIRITWGGDSERQLAVGGRFRRTSRLGAHQFFFQRAHFLQQLVRTIGFDRVDPADGIADVNHHVVAQPRLRDEIQGNLPHDSAEFHPRASQLVLLLNLDNLPWDGKAHGSSPRQPVQHSLLPRSVTFDTRLSDDRGN